MNYTDLGREAGRLPAPECLFEARFVKDADALLAAIRDGTEWDTRMRARLTANFGVPYNYSGMSYPEIPMPDCLAEVVAALTERIGFTPNNCLANYYPSGEATMGFHIDALEDLEPGTGVAIISLGAERVLRFRRIDDKAVTFDQPLPHGSLLYMPPEVQLEWKHGVPAQPETGPRVSLTFRRLRT